MIRIGFTMFLMVFFVGCNSKTKENADKPVAVMAIKDDIKETEEIPFSIYNYEELKPLLHREDGKTYIVNFWATWCKPCIEELPDFEKTYAEQKSNGVEMILVSLDMPSMWHKRLVPFVNKKNLQGEVVILDDPKMNDWIPKINEDWQGGIPATLIYNQNKRIFYPHGFTYDELNNELEKFLN
ncbi:TlpA disulfide reductase family protein [uncultured Croceitalea sp.]|uniref:TlpA disulfide reductase family protein n=1 Tax=uncultured Croceitalea sp. TaxID=1798908 RepID=UPI0033065A18